MLVTMLATVALDLTQAIIVGIVLSLLLFISQVSRLSVTPTDVDWKRLTQAGFEYDTDDRRYQGRLVSGPLFFGAANQLVDAIEAMPHCRAFEPSMSGVPLTDASGAARQDEHMEIAGRRKAACLHDGPPSPVQNYIVIGPD